MSESERSLPVVAIDGPAGAGKSTAAGACAASLGFVLVDTGALYRGVALAARERGVAWDDAEGLGELTRSLDLRFENDSKGAPLLQVDGEDRSGDIRTPEMARGASDVSKHPPVRDALLGLQRRLGANGGVVLEGRDIGTVVFPDAEAKIFLTASAEIRAGRRLKDLEDRGQKAEFATLLGQIKARDEQDSNRPVAPLKPAEDSVILDTTEMSFEEVVARLVEIVRERSSKTP